MTPLGRLKWIAHPPEVDRDPAAQKIRQHSPVGLAVGRQRPPQDAQQAAAVGRNDRRLRRRTSAIACVTKGALETAAPITVESEGQTAKEKLTRERQGIGVP